jgi:ARG and Rhodanese-Phosphatase-superfamily-associated Protein domain
MTTITDLPQLPFEPASASSFRSLTLVPLFPRDEPSLDYVALTEALADGLLVTEVDEGGDVQTLLVENPLETLVLLYEGEELVGAKQNRMLDRTLLVGARSRQPIPVSCVERGRWAYRTRAFADARRVSYPELRRVKHEGGGQAQTWTNVAQKASRLDAQSPTEAAEEMYVSRAPVLDEYAEALPLAEGQSGVLVALGGVPFCLDYVGRPDVFARLYPKLLAGYALDAIERPDESVPSRVDQFLRGVEAATREPQQPVGVGEARRFASPSVVGSELAVAGELVAVSAFSRTA